MNAVLDTPQTERITLYYREGSSDKVYQAAIEPKGDLFVVNFAYGRRGATLQTGTKTPTPVEYDSAKSAYDKLVGEKKAKGYTRRPGRHALPAHGQRGAGDRHPAPVAQSDRRAGGQTAAQGSSLCRPGEVRWPPDAGSEARGRDSRPQPQGPVDWAARNGVPRGPGHLQRTSSSMASAWATSCMPSTCWNGMAKITGCIRISVVWSSLSRILGRPDSRAIRLAETATDPANKERLFRHLQAEKREGVVFKRLDAPYIPGRPNSGGTQLKHKFYATCSAVVSKINDKRSVELRLLNGQGLDSGGQRHHPAQLQGAVRGRGRRSALPVRASGRAMPCISLCIWGCGKMWSSTNASSPSSNTRAAVKRT